MSMNYHFFFDNDCNSIRIFLYFYIFSVCSRTKVFISHSNNFKDRAIFSLAFRTSSSKTLMEFSPFVLFVRLNAESKRFVIPSLNL